MAGTNSSSALTGSPGQGAVLLSARPIVNTRAPPVLAMRFLLQYAASWSTKLGNPDAIAAC